jgi:Ni2+-binding GTPase involved in maturation of urease and hydrogenase
MGRVRFVLLGGFLGAGKTTLLARLAHHYVSQGQHVAVVTNDQAQDLVDTNSLRRQGLPVQEVAGACFCCRFDDLIGKVKQLQSVERPDVILAEPVGSCTDLVATVVQPLKDLYGLQLSVAPYVVLFKPSHGQRILKNEAGAGFSSKAAYIFRKQLEEADAILINRADELSENEGSDLTRLVETQYPGVPVLRISATTGEGFDDVLTLLNQDGSFGRRILQIEYDTYADGEAELGWLNGNVEVRAKNPFALDRFLLDLVDDLGTALKNASAEIAHLKVVGLADGGFGVANLVSSQSRPELSLPSRADVPEVELIVNARVAIDPEELDHQVRSSIERICATRQAVPSISAIQRFRPGRPQPTHRYSVAAS